MKKTIPVIAILLFVTTILTSCKKKDDNSSSPSISDIVLQGEWKITVYKDDGQDESNHYSGYVFHFFQNGVLTAISNTNNISGTWSDGSDNSQTKLILNFGSTVPFEELNEDWHVISKNSTQIVLQHISGGNGGIDDLIFEKL